MISYTITITGTVQGVGFRPFVYRTAHAHGIRGDVRNDVSGVVIRARGTQKQLDAFLEDLCTKTPPLARIRSCDVKEESPGETYDDFVIVASKHGEKPDVDITRDTAPCAACLKEMRDHSNRRYGHPFINCTDCGPRYTIITGLPYDRPNTTMTDFAMCPLCKAEYENPGNRRFHAQPVCCNDCGPSLSLLDGKGEAIQDTDPVGRAVDLLAQGKILAIKGLGGFHLACRADCEETVVILRNRKRREQKPLAIMTAGIPNVKKFCTLSETEKFLLEGIERPIVICDKKGDLQGIAESVAPGVPTLGMMLPSTPLHALLFDTDRYDALVMTSGNLSSEPICITNEEAVAKLTGIADYFLVNDRPIHIRVDDSIVRILSGNPVLLRRARGYVPAPLPVNYNVEGMVALGGIMKSTVCIGRKSTCYVSQYLGKAENVETLENGVHVLDHLIGVLGVKPERYIIDLHPGGFVSSVITTDDCPVIKIQHHHAHAAACMAENRIDGPSVCLIYDGLGLGDDETLWGGEILVADTREYKRIGHLSPMKMPGGDAATRNPARMAIGALWETYPHTAQKICPWLSPKERQAVISLLQSDINCPVTTSMGRLFDALAAILDICRVQTYEGQPAIELEGYADRNERRSYSLDIVDNGILLLDGPLLLKKAIDDFLSGTDTSIVAARFHNSIVDISAEAANIAAKKNGIGTVCLSGGCFQNALLFERLVKKLHDLKLKPVYHRILSPGDECISFGQAVIGGARRANISNENIRSSTLKD
ncbi:MAG: carbamoyltransferase HypF [Chitinivibrionales bacterium]|nr:carbamoyltransferase HypF [Chitinivibrionales bacterium]